MARYIDADKLMELYTDTPTLKLDGYKVPIEVVRQNIEDIPIADVVEVKHGEWLFEGTIEDVHRRTCSVCNGLFLVRWYDHTYEYRYCPHCGAKMDGGKI